LEDKYEAKHHRYQTFSLLFKICLAAEVVLFILNQWLQASNPVLIGGPGRVIQAEGSNFGQWFLLVAFFAVIFGIMTLSYHQYASLPQQGLTKIVYVQSPQTSQPTLKEPTPQVQQPRKRLASKENVLFVLSVAVALLQILRSL
jgi:hypothetical protein